MAILGDGMCFLFLAATHRCREGQGVALNQRKALWFNIQAEGQGSQRPRRTILYLQDTFSKGKQQEAKVKVDT